MHRAHEHLWKSAASFTDADFSTVSSGQSHLQHQAVVWPVDTSIQLIFLAAAAATVPCSKDPVLTSGLLGTDVRLAHRVDEAQTTG